MALTVAINGDTSGLDRALGKSSSGIKAFGHQISTGSIVKFAAIAGAAVIAANAIWDMANAAAADRAETQKLERVIRRATRGMKDYGDEIDHAIDRGMKLAFTDSETRASLQILVQATGDVDRAMRGNAIAMDIARNSGVGLDVASKAVAKAMNGNDAALRRLIPGLAKGKNAWDTLRDAQRLAGGEARAFAGTTEGTMTRIDIALAELGETFGAAFLPIIDALLPAMLPVIEKLGVLVEKVMPVIGPLIGLFAQLTLLAFDTFLGVLESIETIIGDLATSLEPFATALGDVVAAIPPEWITTLGGFVDWLFKLAKDTLPFIMPLLGPLVLGLHLFKAVIDGMAAILGPIVTWLQKLAEDVGPVLNPLLEKMGPFWEGVGTAIDGLGALFNTIVGLLQKLAIIVLPILNPLVDGLAAAWGLVESAIDGIAGFLRDIEQAARDPVGAIADMIAKIGEIPSTEFWQMFGPNRPSPFEDGEPRAQAQGMSASTRGATMAPGNVRQPGVTINILGDPMTIERTVVRSLRTYGRRNGGRLDFALPSVLP